MEQTYIFTGSYTRPAGKAGGEGICVFRFNPADGSLERLSCLRVPECRKARANLMEAVVG